ncbi:hypothetical protein [Geminocystis sp. NIES-3709]|uniref:hypothetical protein n=1 Tax=Geminocystis sp. NIES-3709 TaxID=1617448 RepID=UPI0005FC93BF|nr:hypothetical protein [Geminocystis sp. NIES-3709]BAQ63943.1 hypothetical protein GM3709_708 [Geminocystis sp. NIES-3709]
MTLNQFLKNNPDLQFGYYPEQNQKIIIRFWESDKTGRDKQLSRLLLSLKLPYCIIPRKKAFFYLILPHFYS